MFVRCKKRFKDGKEHRYWSVVESTRVGGGRVVQRQLLYLGEINDSQRAEWCRSIEVLSGGAALQQMALFPEDRPAPVLDCDVVQIQLDKLELRDPRQWGACWLAAGVVRTVSGWTVSGARGCRPAARAPDGSISSRCRSVIT